MSHNNPRRRPLKEGSRLSLNKSSTFTSPPSIPSDICDLENYHYMPRRSPTSTEQLEELVNNANCGDAAVQRVANLLKDLDKQLAGHKSSASILKDQEVLPVPSFMLDSTSMNGTPMDIDCKPLEHNPHDHASDSGLGSSVSSSKYGMDHLHLPAQEAPHADLLKGNSRSVNTSITSHSAITQSFSATSALDEKHALSEYACEQIHEYIIKPILDEDSLKDFHPLIKDVPRRIGSKTISNLRDLEKTLIFLAPVSGIRYLSESAKAYCILRGFKEYSATPKSYLRFCERSVQLLQATVSSLPTADQRLPTDRPYTNNYFLDLMQQIRRYAAIMAATRQKEANGEQLDEMDYSRYGLTGDSLFEKALIRFSDEKITLRGGLAISGRPLELVREKNGKQIPVVEGADDVYTGYSSKRGLSDDEVDDEGVCRSMARRRKSDKPGDVMHMCRDCKKEFKRPCDLTKHEKTHSRPWKCSEEKCKYFELGWPTEKERDRHVNDKHSAAPPQFKCMFKPCTYASKRESNCKQHMEKAHGWHYIRSKSNGRKKAPPASNGEPSPPTPLTPSFGGTPGSVFLATPTTPFISPSMSAYPPAYDFGTPAFNPVDFQDDYRRNSSATDALTYSSGPSPIEPNSFENAVTPDDVAINHGADIFSCNVNNYAATFQQPTPAMSTGMPNMDDFAMPMQNTGALPHLSPTAQPDVTLFSSHMNMDEGFSEDVQAFDRPTVDFTLFDSTVPSTGMNLNTSADFFPDINQFGGQFESNPQFDNSLFGDSNFSTALDDMVMGNFNPNQ